MINTAALHGSHQPPAHWTLFGDPEQFNAMPLTHRDQILFLDHGSTQLVYDHVNRRDMLCGDDGWGNTPFSGGCFQQIERHQWRGDASLRKWLYQRQLPFACTVFLLPVFGATDDPAIQATWKMVVKYAPTIFKVDNLVIIGQTFEWCLYYHHDGLVTFASKPDRTKARW